MKTTRVIGVTAAALVLGIVGATQAFAVDNSMSTDDSSPGGKVQFTMKNDVVKVCDQEADGYAAKVWVYNTDGSTRYTLQAGGEDTCKTKSQSDGGVYNLPEDKKLGFKICLHKSGSDSYCDTAYWNNNE